MFKWFKKKEIEKCSHGYPITDENKLPLIRTYKRIEVCKECAIKSALSELGDGIILSGDILEELKEKLEKIKKA